MSEVSKQSLTMQPIEQQCQMLIGSTLRGDDPAVKLTRQDLHDFLNKCGDNVSVSRARSSRTPPRVHNTFTGLTRECAQF